MNHLLTKWHSEDDPLTREQVAVLGDLLDGQFTEKALEGFLIVCSRFVDEFGHHRTQELANIFRTHLPEGKKALIKSLEYINEWIGGMESYLHDYPVTIKPASPVFAQFKIIGIETLATNIYRIMSSKGDIKPTGELLGDYIQRTGRLPTVPIQKMPALRYKRDYHWCSYDKWDSLETTREMLQILPEWSDCRLRATLLTTNILQSAYVCFSGDKTDPKKSTHRFYKYFYEPQAQDHPPLLGGGTQIAVDGAPLVETLEQWDKEKSRWLQIWNRSEGR